MAKVSVIISAYNYGKYLGKCIESVLNQAYDDYEIIIIDDGSTDNTADVLKEYEDRENIKIIRNEKNLGLIVSCDNAIRGSAGEYIIRLDADDYFDDNALLVLSSFLDKNPEIGMVYSDYFNIRHDGKVLEYVRCPKIGEEDRLMDMPANGAGSMFRRSCYDAIGGYNKNVRYQDNYDIWIKMINKFKVANVNLPLFYYRKHGLNMSSDINRHKKLQSRRRIKDEFAQNHLKKKIRVLGIIPARAKFDVCEMLPLKILGDKSVMAYTIEEAQKVRSMDRVVVTTESKEIADAACKHGVDIIMRPPEFSDVRMPLEHTVINVLDKLKETGYVPDAVVVLQLDSPFKTHKNISEAINTLIIYDVDSVVSVYEDIKLHYQHGPYGMKPLFEKRVMRRERESLYTENGAIKLSKTGAITKDNFLGKKISHVLMTPKESMRMDSKFNFWIAEQMAKSGWYKDAGC
jgi:glycosyltransferase involved in cell wall biosynthesis